jgi:site-specific DNA recombinase
MTKQAMPQGKGAAIIYCRVSTKGQEDDGTSLDSQEQACRRHAEQLGYTVGRVTREVYTGAELWDRPKLAQDRADLKAGQFQALIVYAIDRLSRDPVHIALIAEECERSGVELAFVAEPLDSSPEGALIRYVKGYAAKIEREKIRERALRGRKARVQSGKVPGAGFDLYGYRKDRQTGLCAIVEHEAAVIRDIYIWIGIEGLSINQVIDRLHARGVPSPSVGKIAWTDGRVPRWGNGTIGRILRQTAYKGEAYGWRYTVKHENGRIAGSIFRPRDEWVRLPDGVVPAIVTPALWNAVQRQLETNKGVRTRNMDKARRYLLRGLVVCAVCGRKMYASPIHSGVPGYRCSSRATESGKCGSGSIVAHILEPWVWDQVANVLRNPEIIAAEVRRLQQDGPDPIVKTDLENARRALAKLDKQQAGLGARLRDALDDAVLWDLLKTELGKIERERGELQAAVADLEKRLSLHQQVTDQLAAIPAYCARVQENLGTLSFDEKRLALEALDIKVTVNGRDWKIDASIPLPSGELYRLP